MIAALSPGEAPIGAIRGEAVGERILLRRGRFGGYKENTCARRADAPPGGPRRRACGAQPLRHPGP